MCRLGHFSIMPRNKDKSLHIMERHSNNHTANTFSSFKYLSSINESRYLRAQHWLAGVSSHKSPVGSGSHKSPVGYGSHKSPVGSGSVGSGSLECLVKS